MSLFYDHCTFPRKQVSGVLDKKAAGIRPFGKSIFPLNNFLHFDLGFVDASDLIGFNVGDLCVSLIVMSAIWSTWRTPRAIEH
jgi:hypothetical protein